MIRASLLIFITGAALAGAPERILFSGGTPPMLSLLIANADGTGERPLLQSAGADYDPTWSPDGQWIAFTSERNGSADLYRVHPDGSALEQLTDSPAYDDQASFSPDGRQLVFVSTRAGGKANLWTLNLMTRKVTPLTSGAGGDFRPSWSPDGQWIAFSSDRAGTLRAAKGRWELVHLVDVYLIHPDGTGLKQLTPHGDFCGSPKWSRDSKQLVMYCMSAEDTLSYRVFYFSPTGGDSRLVAMNLDTGLTSTIAAAPGVKMAPVFLASGDVAYINRDARALGIFYASGRTGPGGLLHSAAWSPDGLRVVYCRQPQALPGLWEPAFSWNASYELVKTGGALPAFHPSGDQFTAALPPTNKDSSSGLTLVKAFGGESRTIYQQKDVNVLSARWSPHGDALIFGIGAFKGFTDGFDTRFKTAADRVAGGAQVAMINPDGSGYREVTAGANSNGYPSMAPDGERFVYRTFGPEGNGLRIKDLRNRTVRMLTDDYDNFPQWSPRRDLITFTRRVDGDYEIFTIHADGTGLRRLTKSTGVDSHSSWSPDGEHIVFTSGRMGFKDEALYTNAPQPYGEILIMRYDGTRVERLTDNQWEDGTPTWQPRPKVTGN